MAKKLSPMTDIKSLPKWQKYTIIGILFALALAFTMSGAMVAVVEYATQKGGKPMGTIDGDKVEFEQFSQYYNFYMKINGIASTGQNPNVKSLLFSKMPVKSPIEGVQAYSDSYYIDYISREIENKSTEDKSDTILADILNKLVWNHMLLYKLAEEEDIEISDESIHETAREVILGSPQKPRISTPNEISLGGDDADNGTEDNEDNTAANNTELKEKWLAELRNREAMYNSQLATEFKMEASDFERIVRECLTIKRYMDGVIAKNVSVTRQDILKNIDSFKTEMLLEYIRVKTDDPEVLKRAKEKLSDEMAMLALKRDIWENGNLMSGTEIFSDPLEKIYNAKIQSDDKEFEKPKYIIKVIMSEFDDINPVVVVPDEIVEQFYEHYKSVFFENERTEDDINKQIDKEQKKLKEELKKKLQTLPADAPDKEDPEKKYGDDWRKERFEELRYKPFKEVKAEAEKLTREMATPKYAAATIKKLSDEIKDRKSKNAEAFEDEKRNKEEIQFALRQLEGIFFANDQNSGAIELINDFKKAVMAEIDGIKRKCAVNYDIDEADVNKEIDMKTISEALIKAGREIEGKKVTLMGDLKFTENPYTEDSIINQIASTQRELYYTNLEIENAKSNKDLDLFKRLDLLQQKVKIIERQLELLESLRSEIMLTLKQVKEAFREIIVMSESFNKDSKLTKGFIDAYFTDFTNKIEEIFGGFDKRMKINEIADEINASVQKAEIDLKRFESSHDEIVNDLSKELPPETLIDLKVNGIPYREIGLKIHDIKLSKVYRGTSIKGMWGAGVSPYEYISAMSVEDMKKDPWIQKNMPYLLNATKWEFKTGTASGTKFEDVLSEMKVGEYSEPVGVMGVGVYIIYLEEKIDNKEPEFDAVRDQMIEDFIDQNVSEIAEEYAKEIRSEIINNFNEIVNATAEEILAVAEKYITDKNVLEEVKTELVKSDPVSVSRFKKVVTEYAYKNAAEKYNLELKKTDYVNINSDIEDIAYDSTSDKDFILGCMLLAPNFELSNIAKETRPDKERDTKTNASYIFARVIDTRESSIKGAKVDPSDIVDDEVELLYQNLWARKVIASKKIMDLTEIDSLVDKLKAIGVDVEINIMKIENARHDRAR